jgi:PAS domain S-box-containing protein
MLRKRRKAGLHLVIDFESDDIKRARLDAILHDSDDAIILEDIMGRVRIWNPAAEKLFGYTQQEVLRPSQSRQTDGADSQAC